MCNHQLLKMLACSLTSFASALHPHRKYIKRPATSPPHSPFSHSLLSFKTYIPPTSVDSFPSYSFHNKLIPTDQVIHTQQCQSQPQLHNAWPSSRINFRTPLVPPRSPRSRRTSTQNCPSRKRLSKHLQ